jgi:NTP pyrophosphatase (non-canonical NTP hydrolase)
MNTKTVQVSFEIPENMSSETFEVILEDLKCALPDPKNIKVEFPDNKSMEMTIFDAIRVWARDKGILEHGDPKTQSLKLVEEVGELACAVIKQDQPGIKDAIGDCVVVLVSVAHLTGMSIEECIQSAYDVISKRKGEMKNGNFVKSE